MWGRGPCFCLYLVVVVVAVAAAAAAAIVLTMFLFTVVGPGFIAGVSCNPCFYSVSLCKLMEVVQWTIVFAS